MNNNTEALPDLQNDSDTRGVVINKTGVTGFKLPIFFQGKEVVATLGAYVSLPHILRGANFSRFLLVCSRLLAKAHVTPSLLKHVLMDLRDQMDSEDAYIDIEFDYLVEKFSPVTNIGGGYQSYKLGFISFLKKVDGVDQISIIRKFEVQGSTY